jgi:hypothetical protein
VRQLADLVGDVVVTKLNQFAAERISSRLLIAPPPITTRFDSVSSKSVSQARLFTSATNIG